MFFLRVFLRDVLPKLLINYFLMSHISVRVSQPLLLISMFDCRGTTDDVTHAVITGLTLTFLRAVGVSYMDVIPTAVLRLFCGYSSSASCLEG